jgi:hypothetical protein
VETSQTRFLGPLPTTGPWNAVGLSRGQFLGILLVSLAVFLFLGGPVWAHLRDSHFTRVGVSYAVIPLLVSIAQWRSGTLRPGLFLGASALLTAAKLVLTAGLTIALGIAAPRG